MGRTVPCWRQPPCPIHAFELRIKVVQPPHLTLGQLGRVVSSGAQSCMWGRPRPNVPLCPVLLPALLQRLAPTALLRKPSLCSSPPQSLLSVTSFQNIWDWESFSPIPELLVLSCSLSSAHLCCHSLCCCLRPGTAVLCPSKSLSRGLYVGQEPFPLLFCVFILYSITHARLQGCIWITEAWQETESYHN